MTTNISIIISAPSGAGKTTLIRRLMALDDRFEFSISVTTRYKRYTETPGRSYHFVEPGEFRRMIDDGEFVEWATVHDNLYGTTKKEIDRIRNAGKIPVFDLDTHGARVLQKKIKEAVSIFIIPPSRSILEERLRNRKTDSEEQLQLRLRNSIKEMEEFRRYDYCVINDDLETAVGQIRAIVTAEECATHRLAGKLKRIMEDGK